MRLRSRRHMQNTESKTEAIDRALESIRAQAGQAKSDHSTRGRRSIKRIVRTLAFSVLLFVLSFPLLVKVSVWLYQETSSGMWLALIGGAIATITTLTLATMLISYRVSRRFVPTSLTIRSIALLVVVYCLYSLLFISGANVKSAEVSETYRSLHPLLRLSVSTLVVVDDRLVVTDAARLPEDYAAMGLTVNEASLHFEQNTGYVHAVDLRTIGRSAARNAVIAAYFRLMGFRTLRHVGTADHLHVSLPVQ